MWTKQNRCHCDRSKLRYPSDLTDDEWRLVEPLIAPCKRGGSKRTVVMPKSSRPVVRSIDGLSVASDPEGPAAEKHGLRVFRSMDL